MQFRAAARSTCTTPRRGWWTKGEAPWVDKLGTGVMRNAQNTQSVKGGDSKYMDKTALRLMGAAIAAALAFAATSMSQIPRIAIAIVVGLPSVVLIIIGRRQLGNSFSVKPKAKELVTTGLYSKIQHPLYVFLDLFLLAVIVAFQLPVMLWAWGILVVVHAIEARREEKVLLSAFGPSYEEYRRRSWF